MSENLPANLPEPIAGPLQNVPRSFIPNSLKALDRLVGAVVDLPVAKLNQWKAQIESKTRSLNAVEAAIGAASADLVAHDPRIIDQASHRLVRSEYRKQTNREAIAMAVVEELAAAAEGESIADAEISEIEDDWLNVFERFSEDASSERMQKLWGRVAAGEIRQPGRFSLRTLRFLSEFSQADATRFSDFAKLCFGAQAPAKLATPDDSHNVQHLIDLAAAGLIQYGIGLGLNRSHTCDENGNAFVIDGSEAILFRCEPKAVMSYEIIPLTPLGQELILLLPDRSALLSARPYAEAVRSDIVKECYLGKIAKDGLFYRGKQLW